MKKKKEQAKKTKANETKMCGGNDTNESDEFSPS